MAIHCFIWVGHYDYRSSSSYKKEFLEISDKKSWCYNDLAESNFEFNSSIEFKDFNFAYEESNNALENINFTINKGETIGVVGKTGSGKTTFIKQLLRLYPVNENTLLFDGKGIECYYDYSVRAKIGYAPQEYQLFSKSIKRKMYYSIDMNKRID